MSKAIRRIVFLFVIAAYSLPVFCQQGGITIAITNIRSEMGIIRLALYDHQNQFPDEPSKSFDFSKAAMIDGSLEVILDDISPGSYAISVLDDEDENDRMKFNLLRMPKEGYGFSNNVKVGIKCPLFEKCSFDVGTGNIHLEIEIRYFGRKESNL